MNGWYATLNRPPLTPPDVVFGPVWTVLYVMIATAVVLYLRAPRKPHEVRTMVVLVVHLASNVLWTTLFFGLRSPALALVDILVLDATLVLLVAWFRRVRPWSGYLLLPYLAWVLFATYLNIGFLVLNP